MFSSNKRAIKCWDWEKNGDINPNKLKKWTRIRAWFICEICNHSFSASIDKISGGGWCPFCANKKLCDENCTICFNKSFSSHEKAIFWSNKNILTARQSALHSDKKFWFDCDICKHEFLSSPNSIVRGRWCPFCSNKMLCDDTDCNFCLNKSFASHEKSANWSKLNTKTAREVFKNTPKKYLFDCACGHTFLSNLSNVSHGEFCPYCASKILCENESCDFCEQKSFKSHPKAIFWSPNNDKTPRQVFRMTNLKYLFICEFEHEFFSSPNHVINERWCPYCFRKGEKKLYEALKEETYDVIREKRFDWCINEDTGHHLRFDIKIKNGYRVLIELDGKQHFHQVRNWDSPTKTQQRDLHKMNLANENGYAIIRITWDLVFYNLSDWKTKLVEAIENIEPSTRMFICANNEYDIYQTEE